MKAYTHPPRIVTTLQIKDGSTAQKRWLYFRQNFTVEAESKAWIARRKVQSVKAGAFRATKSKNKLDVNSFATIEL